jgi:hypothetical protein
MDLLPRAWEKGSYVSQLMERTGFMIPKGQRTDFFGLREYPSTAQTNLANKYDRDALTFIR